MDLAPELVPELVPNLDMLRFQQIIKFGFSRDYSYSDPNTLLWESQALFIQNIQGLFNIGAG